jgi:hypothetical protein
MKYLRNFYSSPYSLSLIPFIIIAILIQNSVRRYLIEVESSINISKDLYIRYDDLDNDGSSEELAAVNQPSSTGIAISTENGIVNHFSFRGSFNFSSKSCLFITGDKDGDGTKEIYSFTL